MIRLRALRVAEVGCFSAPVAIENFGNGLNVLSGPNELGKSTLLRALEVVMTAKYSSTDESVRKLVPNIGGSPLIEAEFEAEGHLWRIRKQYLGSATAMLQDLTTGTPFKKAEAETRLAALIKGPADLNRFGMLWVKQDDSLAAVAPESMGSGLAALIGNEVAAVSLDAPARAAHKAIVDALKALQTEATGKPKAKGAWAIALKTNDDAVKRLASAEARATEQAGRLDELSAHIAERETLLAPDATARRADALATIRARHAKAIEALRQRREATQTLAAALALLQAVEREDTALRTAIDECMQIKITRETDQAILADLVRRRDNCAADLATARACVESEAAAGAALEAEIVLARRAADAHALAVERDRLAARIIDARAAIAEHARARAESAAHDAVTEAQVKALGASIAKLAQLDAALAAVVPEIAITLEPAGAGRIVADGKPLAHSITLNPHAPLTLEIAGVGRITIAPNPATLGAPQRNAREQHRAEVEAAYARMAVASLGDAEARLSANAFANAAAREATVKLQAIAPRGIDALIAAHADLAARSATASGHYDVASIDAIEAQLTVHRLARETTQGALQRAQAELTDVREDLARQQAAQAARIARLVTLEMMLGDAAAQGSTLAAAAVKLASVRNAYSAAKSAADAWAVNTDADNADGLAADVRAVEAANAASETRRVALEQSIHGLESALRVAGDADVESALETAGADATTAAARLADVEGEVKALNLLDREFRAIADAGRSTWSGPILERIQPYLTHVLPDAQLELGDKLMPSQLRRDGRTEAHAQLSRGTQEQIAILVRLGLARLLADQSAAVPLILDDALVYADDRRIAHMFKALEDAARLHQVIVLNCREQTFAALANAPGAKVLAFAPWVPVALAA